MATRNQTCLLCNQYYDRKPHNIPHCNSEEEKERAQKKSFVQFKEGLATLLKLSGKDESGSSEGLDGPMSTLYPFASQSKPSSSATSAILSQDFQHPCCNPCYSGLVELHKSQKKMEEAQREQEQTLQQVRSSINIGHLNLTCLPPKWIPVRAIVAEIKDWEVASIKTERAGTPPLPHSIATNCIVPSASPLTPKPSTSTSTSIAAKNHSNIRKKETGRKRKSSRVRWSKSEAGSTASAPTKSKPCAAKRAKAMEVERKRTTLADRIEQVEKLGTPCWCDNCETQFRNVHFYMCKKYLDYDKSDNTFGFDLCLKCYGKGVHQQHEFIRVFHI